jgi:gluconolactonase
MDSFVVSAITSALLVALAASTVLSSAQQPAAPAPSLPAVGRVVKLDPALERIVATDASVEKIAGNLKFAEGPLWTRDGSLLFSDGPANIIYKLKPGGQPAIFRQPSGYDGTDLPESFFKGSNGLTFDKQGRLILSEHGNRRLTRLERDGTLTVLADKYEGKRINSPDDVIVKSDGSIYFADPPYGLQGGDTDPKKELPYSGIFRVVNGKVELLNKAMARPNGLGFSPDEKYLYVSNSEARRKIWMRFGVKSDGTLDEGAVFLDVTSERAPGVPDGLKLDTAGNLYGTGPGGIWIISPQAKPLGRIELPEAPANMAWGDRDGKTLYITARTSVYRVRMKASGKRPCC